MSSFDEFIQIQQRISNIYNLIRQSVNMDSIIAKSNALDKSMANIVALQASHQIQENLVNFSRNIWASMNIDYSKIVNISESMQTIVQSVQPNIEWINANLSLLMRNNADMVSDLNSIGYNISELV